MGDCKRIGSILIFPKNPEPKNTLISCQNNCSIYSFYGLEETIRALHYITKYRDDLITNYNSYIYDSVFILLKFEFESNLIDWSCSISSSFPTKITVNILEKIVKQLICDSSGIYFLNYND